MNKSDKLTVGEIVANDFRAASIFKNAGIDFCCGGKRSLSETCEEKGINPATLEKELKELEKEPLSPSLSFKDWDPGFLSDYIMNTHHKFVLKNLPELVFYTQKIASVHGGHHAELIEIAELFAKINQELLQHLKNEEEVLFPAIKKALASNSADIKETIISEISRMTGEHEFAGGAMDRISEISNHYLVPADGCNTYAVTYKLLQQFEDDLHIHVHLENNILYPKALSLAEA
ncbi:MAG: iron-sulfur cluster repair di-iron protein [Porphyromonadaceae bacterium]|nr:MAG: iron-sulfur cluster repair di-iron protein [Porphyromonadaceae bacterium]